MKRLNGDSTARSLLLLVGIVTAGVILAWFKTDHKPASNGPNDRENPLREDWVRRFLDLEKVEENLRGTLWAPEITAQSKEDFFLSLWNKLNAAPDPWSVLAEIDLQAIRFPSLSQPTLLPHGIITKTHSSSSQNRPLFHWSKSDWLQRIEARRDEGWKIGRTHWRLLKHESHPGQLPVSQVAFSIQFSNSFRPNRWIMRGILNAHWSAEPSSPAPTQYQADPIEWVGLETPPMFERVLSTSLTPHQNSHFADPLLVQDLDGDGRLEILLPGANWVFRRRGTTWEGEPLANLPPGMVSAGLCLDLFGRGLPQLILAMREGLYVFDNDGKGRFTSAPRLVWPSEAKLKHPQVLTAGDVDGDGRADLWLGQYKIPYQGGQFPTPYFDANDGFPSYLLIQQPSGNFLDATASAGLDQWRFRRNYSASWVDLDQDQDLDLVSVSDFAGIDYYLNNGKGSFKLASESLGDARHLFGMAHAVGDLNRDGRMDVIAIGMDSPVASRLDSLGLQRPGFEALDRKRGAMTHGNRIYSASERGLEPASFAPALRHAGWAWGVTLPDFDNDGDLDVAIANGHETFPDVTDFERQFWLHDIYVGGSSNDPVRDLYFKSAFGKRMAARQSYGGWQDNAFFLNLGGGRFLEAAFPLGVAVPEDSQGLASADLDRDGRMDLIVLSFSPSPARRPRLDIYRNVLPSTAAWIGFRFRGAPMQSSGARIDLVTEAGRQSRWLVTGDSYRTQHPAEAHFGLGGQGAISAAEVHWPGGRVTKIESLELNRWHEIVWR